MGDKVMLGVTYSTMLDASLDHITAMVKDRNDALDALNEFTRNHPEHDNDVTLTRARIALQ